MTNAFLANQGIFADLSKEIKAGFEKRMIERIFSQGEIIFREGTAGDGCFIIKNGRVMLYSFSPLGERKIFDIISEGDVIGEMAMIDGEPRSMTAECLTEVKADYLARKDFEREILAHREAIIPFLKLVVRRLRRLDQHVEEIIFQGVPSRVAAAIVYLAGRFGQQVTENGRQFIRLQVTHSELADLVGTSREYTSKFLSQFQKDGLLKCTRGTMDIFNLDSIKSWAQ